MLPQRGAPVREVVDPTFVRLEIPVAAAPVERSLRGEPIPGTAGIEGFPVIRVQRGSGLTGQDFCYRRVGSVACGLRTNGYLVRGRALSGGKVRCFIPLQQRVPFQLLLDERGDLDIVELQQLDGLTQLRRHDQGLALAEIETRGYRHAAIIGPLVRWSTISFSSACKNRARLKISCYESPHMAVVRRCNAPRSGGPRQPGGE